MKYDAIVIGAGFGGLSCAARLAKDGRRVLLLEKNPHHGGTSYIFYRSGYAFPMGALGFSFPNKVKNFLRGIGIRDEITFGRSHYQIITPNFDTVYSRPFDEFKEDLKRIFPKEKRIDAFFSEFAEITRLVENISAWHPDYLAHGEGTENQEQAGPDLSSRMRLVERFSRMPGTDLLGRYFTDPYLINLLGSQGTQDPTMSVLNLALMWNIMSKEGIWFPSCGIHGLTDLMAKAFRDNGGEIRTGYPVEKIRISGGKAEGVLCRNGEIFDADWVVCNTDYKTTFLTLVEKTALASRYLKALEEIPYTGSELCVYLGLNPEKVTWKAMKATHLFYRHKYDPDMTSSLEDFPNREIEVCLWSDKAPNLIPAGKAALVLRVGFPYDHFSPFRTGEKKRKKDYKPYKEKLAESLVRTAENILPGLSGAVEVIEAATPLTYRDWGQRHLGSLAGWTWTVKNEMSLGGKILVETPVPNMLMAGIYAASELFLGGIPTAVHTGDLAADLILQKRKKY